MTKISESNRRIKYRNSFGLIKNSLTGLIIRECISKDLEIIEVLMEVSDLENKIGQEQGKSFLYIFLVGLFSLVENFSTAVIGQLAPSLEPTRWEASI